MSKTATFFFLSLSFVFLSSSVLAITISPVGYEIDYVPGNKETITFFVSNIPNGVDITLDGSLADHSRIKTDLKTCLSSCRIDLEITVPNLEDQPGYQSMDIFFKEGVPPEGYGQSPLAGKAQVKAKVFLIGPYPNKFLTIDVQTQDQSFRYHVGDMIYFVAHVRNHGRETVGLTKGELQISSQEDGINLSVPLTPVQNLGYKERGEMYAQWDSSDFPLGQYQYKAVVDYDGEAAKAQGLLQLGDKVVKVVGISKHEFVQGTIDQFQLSVENFWNRDLKAEISLTLKAKNGTTMAEAQTAAYPIEARSAADVDAFFDFSDVNSGDYVLEAATFVDDEPSANSSFSILVVEPTPEQSAMQQPARQNYFLALPIVLILIIIMLSFLLLYKYKREGPSQDGF
ncbi:hypothetical protein COV20_03560 [Candidatus Woesearchaeota archaeon CG10_big_fil_rev_8_21_14_0_10_45_16]|nr:MAG: hypothetical protein COV20_03560 [Candidatus Woesearchaeota archaeon CG10_big_fil_rev_8_21_14_0_10_45_16]